VRNHGERAGNIRWSDVTYFSVRQVFEWQSRCRQGAEFQREHIGQEMGAAGIKRYKLLVLGVWQFFCLQEKP